MILLVSIPGEGPHPTEVFTVVRVGEVKVALKSAYGRFVGVASSGDLVGRMEAMGPREQWEAVFEEVNTVLHVHVRMCMCIYHGVR